MKKKLLLTYSPSALFLLCASAVFIAGIQFSKREKVNRIKHDRNTLHAKAKVIQAELFRLEKLYENHLQRIAKTLPLTRKKTISEFGRSIVGVHQISILDSSPKDTKPNEWHVSLIDFPNKPSVRPTLSKEPNPPSLSSSNLNPTPKPLYFSPDLLFQSNRKSGWLEPPGSPLFYWYERPEKNLIFFLLDRNEIQNSINVWLQKKFSNTLLDLQSTDSTPSAQNALFSPSGQNLSSNNVSFDKDLSSPDVTLPLLTSFGTWQFVSWDFRETQIVYHPPTLFLFSTISLFLVLSGSILFYLQKKNYHSAEQRVSFVNRVSHELRTPLTNILLNTELAKEHIETFPEQASASQRLNFVQEEAQRLNRLINNVLTFSRQERGTLKLSPQKCIPDELIKDILKQFEPALNRSQISVSFDNNASLPCFLDQDAFSQIIFNLISNVEKYAKSGGVLNLSSLIRDSQLCLTLSDQGPGIPSSEAQKIFQPFYRPSSQTNEGVTGSGLGLSIARELAQQMGGSLQLVPSEKGATFNLVLPLDPAS